MMLLHILHSARGKCTKRVLIKFLSSMQFQKLCGNYNKECFRHRETERVDRYKNTLRERERERGEREKYGDGHE